MLIISFSFCLDWRTINLLDAQKWRHREVRHEY